MNQLKKKGADLVQMNIQVGYSICDTILVSLKIVSTGT